MKWTRVFLAFAFLCTATLPLRAEEGDPAVALAGTGRVIAEPFQEVYDIRSTLYVSNAQGFISLEGSYRHPYLSDQFQIEWHREVDLPRSWVKATNENIEFNIQFMQPIPSGDLMEIFTARPAFSPGISYPFKDPDYPPHCRWHRVEGTDGQTGDQPMETHTDPLWHMIDFGSDLSVHPEQFPSDVDRVFLSGINNAEVYPPRDLVKFEDAYSFAGGFVVGVNATPLYKLSFIVQTVDGKQHVFSNVDREDGAINTIRLVYSVTGVDDWEVY